MNGIPDYMWLSGDEDGGVTLVCDHPDHDPEQHWGIAYHAGHGESAARGLPYFSSRQLGDLIAFIRDHASTHRGN